MIDWLIDWLIDWSTEAFGHALKDSISYDQFANFKGQFQSLWHHCNQGLGKIMKTMYFFWSQGSPLTGDLTMEKCTVFIILKTSSK